MKIKEIRKQKHPIWPYLSSSEKLRLAFSLSGTPPQAEGSPLSSFFRLSSVRVFLSKLAVASCHPPHSSARAHLPSAAWKKRKKKKTKKLPPASQPQGGSTNMPLFGRVHECKEYEYWNEKKVWIVSVTKWTLSKNKRDPQKDTSKIRTHSSQQMNTKALSLKEKRVSKRL